MSQIHQLYRLQSLDSKLDKANQQLADIAAKLGESQALKDAKKAAEVAEQTLHKIQAKMQDLDLEVKSLSQKITQQEKMLYGGKNLSAKEAANLQDEVASLKRWHGNREELLLEAMVETEEAEESLEQAQTELARVQAEWAADQENLRQTQAELEVKVTEFLEQRPMIAGGIEADDLSEYEDLRPMKAGVAVTLVKNGVCQGCGMAASNSKLRQARAGEALIYCGGCGRILYVP
ncbi:zinc ribbon domain-containing protein [Chloroflexota bacterium]